MRVSTRPIPDPARLTRRVHAMLAHGLGINLPVTLWDGTRLGPSDGTYRIVLNAPWSARAMLLPPTDKAAGEAYIHGDVDIDGDLFAALHAVSGLRDGRLGARARARVLRDLLRLPAPPDRGEARRARLRGGAHTLSRDRAAIAHHYDLPPAFYDTFLDTGRVYSCAYFAAPDEPLETAQERKLDLVCRKLRLQPDERLLDIGCGWGSLLLHAASTYGVRGVGVTLSETQARVARQRIADAGLQDRVEIHLQDYREVTDRFDAIASVGMVEHVGPRNLGEYAGQLHALLVDGGRLLNHGITTGTRATQERVGTERDFIGSYVFPDGGLAPAWRMLQELQVAGFAVIDLHQLRPHYALTLRAWVDRLSRNFDDAVAIAGEPAARTWRLYMAASAVAFEKGQLGVVQILGTRGLPELPLRRDGMEPSVEFAARA